MKKMRKNPDDKDVYVDGNGQVRDVQEGSMTQQQLHDIRTKGEVIVIVLRYQGRVSVEIKGPPNLALVDMLEQAVASYRVACEDLLERDTPPETLN